MSLDNLFNCMITLFLLLGLGFLCSKVGILSPENTRVVSRLVVNVTLPATMLDAILGAQVDIRSPMVRQLAWCVVLFYVAHWLLSVLYGALFVRKDPDRGVYQYMAMFGNTSFLGIPVITALFGQEALFHLAVLNLPCNVISFTYGISLIRGGRGEGKSSLKSALTPPTVASFVGLALFLLQVRLPVPIADTINYLSRATVPCAMMVVGASLGAVKLGEVLRKPHIYTLTAYILLLRPVIIFFIARLFVTDPMVLGVVTVISAVPVAATTTTLCIEYKANEALSSGTILVSTLLSLLTISLLSMVLL